MITDEQKLKAEELFEKHSKMATYYASKFYKYISYGIFTKEDLDQTAMLSLWKACLNFDETKGFKFFTYCSRILLNELVLFKNKSFKYDNEAYISYNASINSDEGDSTFIDILGEKYTHQDNGDDLDINIFLDEALEHINSFLLFEKFPNRIDIVEKLIDCFSVKELMTIYNYDKKDIVYCQKLLRYVLTTNNSNDVFTIKYKIYNDYNDYVLKTQYILRRLDFSDPETKAYSILINNNYSKLVKLLKGEDISGI